MNDTGLDLSLSDDRHIALRVVHGFLMWVVVFVVAIKLYLLAANVVQYTLPTSGREARAVGGSLLISVLVVLAYREFRKDGEKNT